MEIQHPASRNAGSNTTMSQYMTLALSGVLIVAILSVYMTGSGGGPSADTPEELADSSPKPVFEFRFVSVLTMERSGSSHILNRILNSTCFASMGEIYQKSGFRSENAWDGDPLSETLSSYIQPQQYVDFFHRAAQKLCRKKIIHNDASEICQGKCIAGFKEFRINGSFENQKAVWDLLRPNMTVVVLERDLESQWKSWWFATEKADWHRDGEAWHKEKIQAADIPPVPTWFSERHQTWFDFVHENFPEGERIDLTFDEIVAESGPQMVRDKVNTALPPAFQGLLPVTPGTGTTESVDDGYN